MVDREDVVGDPDHIGTICGQQPFDFVDHRDRLAAAVRHAENLVTTPPTLVRASASGDERERALPVSVAPGSYVTHHVDGLSRRPRLRIEIGDLRARLRLVNLAVLTQESDSVYPRE